MDTSNEGALAVWPREHRSFKTAMRDEITPAMDRQGASGSIETQSMDEFEAELARRAKVPADKLEEILRYDERQVRVEAEAVSAILKRFAGAVVDSMDNPGGVDHFLRELDLKVVSRDHHWRTIFAELRTRDKRFEHHKRVLLIKYLQYLSFRKKLLDYIYERKTGLEETDNHPDLTIFPAPGDPSRTTQSKSQRSEFSRVPIGETVKVSMPQSGSVEIMLARHLFRLMGASHPCLVDQNGVTHFLQRGRNMVGRHPESDVVVDPDFHDISRAHAIIEWDGGPQLSITDLSTRGTYVPTPVMRNSKRELLSE